MLQYAIVKYYFYVITYFCKIEKNYAYKFVTIKIKVVDNLANLGNVKKFFEITLFNINTF